MPVRVDPSPKRIRVAVIGGGAVTESFHLPVLRGHDGIELTALVEPDAKRGSRLAAAYQIPKVLPSADTIDSRLADAAVIATPPFLHASGAIDLMTRGLHVLVDKPMALSMADGQDMVSLARQKGLALSVGLFRRLLPAVRLFRAALDSKQI